MTKILLYSNFLLTITISFLKCGVLELNSWVHGLYDTLQGHIFWKIWYPNFAQKHGVSWKPLWVLTRGWTKPLGGIELNSLNFFLKNSFHYWVAYPFFKREQFSQCVVIIARHCVDSPLVLTSQSILTCNFHTHANLLSHITVVHSQTTNNMLMGG